MATGLVIYTKQGGWDFHRRYPRVIMARHFTLGPEVVLKSNFREQNYHDSLTHAPWDGEGQFGSNSSDFHEFKLIT